MIVIGTLLLLTIGGAGIGYLVLAIWAVRRFRPGGAAATGHRPPLTILKPLHGAEPDLYECLRSFCRLDYPELQIIFGVDHASDAALPVVRRIVAEFPERDLALVVGGGQHGANRKVSCFINMMPMAKHDVIVVSDSDVRVSDECLGGLVALLADPAVGAVSAPNRAVARRGLASRLGSMFVNDWYFPQILITEMFGTIRGCLGPLTAVRRDSLDAIGGFPALADQIADDLMLGQMIAASGERVVISRAPVDVMVHDDFAFLVKHEVRWARSIRSNEPKGYFASVVTHTLPITVPLLVVWPSLAGLLAVFLAAILRVVLNRMVCARLGIADRPPVWQVLLRETACLPVWIACYASNRIDWRGTEFVLRSGGDIRRRAPRSSVNLATDERLPS